MRCSWKRVVPQERPVFHDLSKSIAGRDRHGPSEMPLLRGSHGTAGRHSGRVIFDDTWYNMSSDSGDVGDNAPWACRLRTQEVPVESIGMEHTADG